MYALVDRFARRHDEHGRRVGACAQTPQHLEAIDVGQSDIEQQQVEVMRAQRGVRVLAAARVSDAVTLLLQRAYEAFSEQGIVFDDENAQGSSFPARS